MKKDVLIIFLVIAISLPLLLPFFRSGYFPTHDGEWAVVRQGAMHRAFLEHHFPVRWAGNLNFGYGYPLFLFTYPLPYYLGEMFVLSKIGLIGAVKMVFILSIVLSGVGMFFLGKSLFGRVGGIISAAFYLYAPFRLVDLFVRGSIGESLSLALFPFILLAVIHVAKSKSVRDIGILAILFAALLLTHNVMALLFTPFVLVFGVLLIWEAAKGERLSVAKRLCVGLMLGVFISSFFLIPALLEKGHILLSQVALTDVAKHVVSVDRLIVPSWGYGSFRDEDGFSPQLGVVHIVAFLAVSCFLVLQRQKKDVSYITVLWAIGSFFVCLILLLPVSVFFWRNVPLFANVDFPWRTLGPAIFFMSLATGFLGTSRLFGFLGIALAVVSIIINVPYARPRSYIHYPNEYYLTNEATTTSADELMPLWVKQKPSKRHEEKAQFVEGKGTIGNLSFNGTRTRFTTTSESGGVVRVSTVYFPGWHVAIDGKPTLINYQNDKGLITFPALKGTHTIEVVFKETSLRLFTDILSLIGLLIVAVFFARRISVA